MNSIPAKTAGVRDLGGLFPSFDSLKQGQSPKIRALTCSEHPRMWLGPAPKRQVCNLGCSPSGESPSLQLSQLSAEALAPSPDSFYWSSHPLKAGGEGTGIAFHPSGPGQGLQQNLQVSQESPKCSCGDGSLTEAPEGITGCNVLQKFFQKPC